MVGLELYVKDEENVFQRIELFKDESVTITQSLQDVKDIAKVFSDYSQTFNVPASKKNNKVFEHFYNYHINIFDARRKKDAKLYLNHQLFKDGKIKLEGTTLKNNKAHTYKLTFFGSGVNLKDTLGDDKLDALVALSKFNFEYTSANIKTYMTTGLDITTADEVFDDAIIMPLISAKKRFIYDSVGNTSNTDSLCNLGTAGKGAELTQLKPAIRVYAIIKAIEAQSNYNLTFSDDFFNITNLPFYNLYMWLHRKENLVFDDQQPATFFFEDFHVSTLDKASVVSLNNAGTSFTNPPGKGVNKYTSKQNNAQRTLFVDLTPSVATADNKFNFVIFKDGVLFKEYKDLTGDSVGTSQLINKLKIPKGTYTFAIHGNYPSTFTADILVKRDNTRGGSFLKGSKTQKRSFTATATVSATSDLQATTQLPEIKVLDFLTGLFKMFNLTSFQNEDGTIEIKTLDSFFRGTTLKPVVTYDITKEIDKTDLTVDSVLPFKTVTLKYKGLDSFLAKSHNELFNVEWGSLHYSGNEDSKLEGQTYTVEVPFEHFKYERFIDVTGGATKNAQYGWSVDIDQNSYLGKPLLFYAVKASESVKVLELDGVTSSTVLAPFCPSNSYSFSPTALVTGTDVSWNINFNAEVNEYTGRPFELTLFEQFYKTYLKEIFDPKRRLTTTSAYLPLSTILNIKLNDRIKISDRLYKINKMTTNFETNKTVFELINIVVSSGLAPSTVLTDDNTEFKVIIPPVILPVENCITVDTTAYTADDTVLRADLACNTDGVEEFSISLPVPDTIESNIIEPIVEPCTVVAPTLTVATQKTNTATSVFFTHNLTTLGSVCKKNQVSDYGWLIADADATLRGSDDIDTLIGTGGVTNRAFTNGSVGDYTTEVTGLSHPDDKYWRFYARTNTDPAYDKADVISDIYGASTFTGVSYTETTAAQTYHIYDWENIRTIRIKSYAGDIYDYQGVYGDMLIYSKIVPYVVKGAPLPATNCTNITSFTQSPPSYCSFGGYTASTVSTHFGITNWFSTGGFIAYHATDRSSAEKDAIKAKSPPYNYGASWPVYYMPVAKPNLPVNGVWYNGPVVEGTSMYTQMIGGMTLASDGYYALWRVDLDGKSSRDTGLSIRILNGYIQDKQLFYKT